MQDNRTQIMPMTSSQEPHSHLRREIKFPQCIKKIVVILTVVSLVLVIALTLQSFDVLDNQEKYKGKLSPYLPIYSGEIEYSRLPVQYWQHRLMMIKALGLNSVSVYVMWNHHQVERGVFDFNSSNKNLQYFLSLTKKHELKVLLRPGPYVCAEWDFGGLPARLLGVKDLVIRSANELYQAEVKLFFQALAPIISPYLAVNGGNIIMLQIQNEYGYIGENGDHILNLLSMWKQLGIESEFYIEDPGAFWNISYWPGAHIGLSQISSILRYVDIELSPQRSPDSLLFGGQVYSGWFTQWGWNWGTVQTQRIVEQIKKMMEYGRSFSLYMIFGGTNFGVSAGANGFNGWYSYLPHITSYDYDSPISENGRVTPKYQGIRSAFQQNYGPKVKLPQIPLPLPSVTVDSFTPKLQAHLWANLPEPTLSNSDLTYFQSPLLQMYQQGIVIYQTFLQTPRTYHFVITLHDYGLIFIDQQFITSILRRRRTYEHLEIRCEKEEGCWLKVLVEAMGHINFGKDQREDRKGLIRFEEIGREITFKWNIYKLPLNGNHVNNWTYISEEMTFPAVFRAQVNLSQTGDTYFDMQKYKKGYLYVNGHLLGRFWDIGPQERLFCPGVWLQKGLNQIVVLQLLESSAQPIRGVQTLKD